MNINEIKPEDIAGKECRHVTYSVAKDKQSDAIFAKEYLYLKNGEVISHLKMIENMERSFWVTKEARRNHKDKKQHEHVSNLKEYRCREIDLLRRADKALGGYGNVKTKRQLFQSPYLYGCKVKPEAIVKTAYQEKYPDFASSFAKVAVCDTETDVLHGTGDIIMSSLTFKEKAWIGMDRAFFNGIPDDEIIRRFHLKAQELIGDVLKERNVTVEVELFNNAGEIASRTLQMCHKWKPDFVGFWNMPFDLNKMLDAFKKFGYDPDKEFSDPSVPDKYKFFKFKEGSSIKTTHDGTTSSINPEQRWHIAECPATFFLVDGMTLYYRLRIAGGKEESYSLDSVLDRNLNITKLKIDELGEVSGIDWHKQMQANYKFEYAVYNLFDSMSTEMLDEKTKDIAVKFPAQTRNSSYTDFKSGPSKIADNIHFQWLKSGYVVGVTDGDVRDENDSHVLKPQDWIITLPSFMSTGMGIDFVTME